MDPGCFQLSQKVLLRRQDTLLILRDRNTQRGDLPGGRIAHDEFFGDWQDALMRELREELGSDLLLRLRPDHLFLFPHTMLATGEQAVIVLYEATYQGGTLSLSDEHDQYEWVSLDTFDPSPFFTDSYASAIRRYKQLVTAA